jgi:hypothetical protein
MPETEKRWYHDEAWWASLVIIESCVQSLLEYGDPYSRYLTFSRPSSVPFQLPLPKFLPPRLFGAPVPGGRPPTSTATARDHENDF